MQVCASLCRSDLIPNKKQEKHQRKEGLSWAGKSVRAEIMMSNDTVWSQRQSLSACVCVWVCLGVRVRVRVRVSAMSFKYVCVLWVREDAYVRERQGSFRIRTLVCVYWWVCVTKQVWLVYSWYEYIQVRERVRVCLGCVTGFAYLWMHISSCAWVTERKRE